MFLEYNDWIKLAYEEEYILKWEDLKNTPKNEKITLAASLSQGYYVSTIEENHVCDPVVFFKNHKQVYIHHGFVDEGSKRILNGEAYPDGLFYEYQGDAVLGSGADISMKWKHLKKMPQIYYRD